MEELKMDQTVTIPNLVMPKTTRGVQLQSFQIFDDHLIALDVDGQLWVGEPGQGEGEMRWIKCQMPQTLLNESTYEVNS